MDGMAARALDAVATKDITIMPERFEKVTLQLLNDHNILL
jgi:hypothetical protein